ncbi:hypothetical protein [Streptomyces sp. 8N706]
MRKNIRHPVSAAAAANVPALPALRGVPAAPVSGGFNPLYGITA